MSDRGVEPPSLSNRKVPCSSCCHVSYVLYLCHLELSRFNSIEGYLNGEPSNLHRQVNKTRCGSPEPIKYFLLFKGFTFLVYAFVLVVGVSN
jgi:hypothetical protein